MDLAKRLVETFKQMADQNKEDAECYTVKISYDDGFDEEFTFTAEEMENITDEHMEEYLRTLIDGNFH